jgi:hypothetical protein
VPLLLLAFFVPPSLSCFRVDATLQSERTGLETRAAHLSR